MNAERTLVAGIGNVFLGDDGFGVEVARRLAERPRRDGIDIADFGIRGFDLALALTGYERAILLDAAARGGAPGTLYVIEPDLAAIGVTGPRTVEAHGVVPERALGMAAALGGRLRFVRIVACEPAALPQGDDVIVALSAPVAAAVDAAVALVEELLGGSDA